MKKKMLKKLEGKDLDGFGIRAESTLKNNPENLKGKNLKFTKEFVEKNYT